MASINWQDSSEKNSSPRGHSAPSSRPAVPLGFIIGIMSGAAFSMLLMGLIAGYTIGKWVNPAGAGYAANARAAVAQVPSAPTPTPTPTPTPQAAQAVAPIDPKTDRINGDLATAKVAVIEYSDFECPFCKRLYDDAEKQIRTTYGSQVVWVYRDFPLSFHQNAHKEAEAGRCVNELGGNAAFWKYHDYVFEKTTSNGTGFPLDQLPVAAQQAGVDAKKFQTCLDSGKYVKAVDDQEAEGGAAGVQGTPGNFVVNLKTQKSQAISGAVPFATFKTAIDAALQS